MEPTQHLISETSTFVAGLLSLNNTAFLPVVCVFVLFLSAGLIKEGLPVSSFMRQNHALFMAATAFIVGLYGTVSVMCIFAVQKLVPYFADDANEHLFQGVSYEVFMQFAAIVILFGCAIWLLAPNITQKIKSQVTRGEDCPQTTLFALFVGAVVALLLPAVYGNFGGVDKQLYHILEMARGFAQTEKAAYYLFYYGLGHLALLSIIAWLVWWPARLLGHKWVVLCAFLLMGGCIFLFMQRLLFVLL